MVLPKSGRVGRRRVFIKKALQQCWAFFLTFSLFKAPEGRHVGRKE
jgi:hypothetical protein